MSDTSSGIFCTVDTCHYNKDGKTCTADKVQVGSQKTCCSSCDTECVTFRPAK